MVRRTLTSIKNLLVKEQNEIISAAAMLMVLAFVTKITGMVFLTLFSRAFGTSDESDIFYLASILPETITNIILMGAISGSIIPIFIKIKEEKGEKLYLRSFSSTFNISMVCFALMSLIAAIFAKQLVPLAINMTESEKVLSPDQVDQVVLMMRVLLIPQILLAVSAFVSTTLNIYHRFIIPQLAPLFFNIGRIFGVLVLVPIMGNSVWGLVWGICIGSILHLAIQIPLLRHLNINIKVGFVDLKDRYFKQVLGLGIPRVLSLGAEQIAVIADSLIAFGLTTVTYNPLSAYQLAIRLISFPLNLLGTSFAVAAFPSLSKLHAQGAVREFSLLTNRVINQILFLSIPVSVLFLVLRVPIVRLVYGILDGRFDWNDTLQVSWVVMFFSLGLMFEILRSAMFRVYYAVHNSIIPLLSSIFVVIFGIITGVMFTNYFSHFDTFSLRQITFNLGYFFEKSNGRAGVGGLALSSSLVFTLEFFFLLVMLKRLKVIDQLTPVFKEMGKKLLAGLIMLVVSYAMAKLWEEVLNTAKVLPLLMLTGTTMAFSLMLYIWTSFVFKISEVELFVGFIVRSIKKITK